VSTPQAVTIRVGRRVGRDDAPGYNPLAMDVSPESLAVIGQMVGGAWALKEVAKPAFERLGKEIESFLLGPRRERAAELLTDAAAMLKDADVQAQPVPGRILMPLLEYGSWEDEPDMRRKWAALLANAASATESNQVLPAFIEILRQLTPMHAHFIDLAWRHQIGRGGELVSDDLLKDGLFLVAGQSARREFELIATDLLRLGVIDRRPLAPPHDRGAEE
jgi:hypothetical protein